MVEARCLVALASQRWSPSVTPCMGSNSAESHSRPEGAVRAAVSCSWLCIEPLHKSHSKTLILLLLSSAVRVTCKREPNSRVALQQLVVIVLAPLYGDTNDVHRLASPAGPVPPAP